MVKWGLEDPRKPLSVFKIFNLAHLSATSTDTQQTRAENKNRLGHGTDNFFFFKDDGFPTVCPQHVDHKHLLLAGPVQVLKYD